MRKRLPVAHVSTKYLVSFLHRVRQLWFLKTFLKSLYFIFFFSFNFVVVTWSEYCCPVFVGMSDAAGSFWSGPSSVSLLCQ